MELNSENGQSHGLPTHSEIVAVERAFDDIETELIRYQAKISSDAYKRRAALIERIPNFWAVVFENPPEELASALDMRDADAISCLVDFSVHRFDVDSSPRSFSLIFIFRENDWFEDRVLEKKFWYRHSTDGWSGLVSEPVRIRWKKGKDLTNGFLDAAADLFEAERKERESSGKLFLDGHEREALEEHAKLKKMLHDLQEPLSFFAFFGFISEARYITPQESESVSQKLTSASAVASQMKGGDDIVNEEKEAVEEDEEDEEDLDEDGRLLDVEICPPGASIASVLAEDLWPNALRFYASAMEDEPDVEYGSDDDDDIELEDQDEEVPQLVKKRSASTSAGASFPKIPKTGQSA